VIIKLKNKRYSCDHFAVDNYAGNVIYLTLIEGMVNDCQLVLLPLKGDKFFNSKLIAVMVVRKSCEIRGSFC
jgi:hypothetical protein